jgi:hypothetical protein
MLMNPLTSHVTILFAGNEGEGKGKPPVAVHPADFLQQQQLQQR